jgi:DNA-binding transcriptional regulator YiaG
MGRFDAGGALSGAASGAALGSYFTPIGTAVGAIAGGLLGAFGRRKRKPKRLSTLDPTQQALYNDYASGIQGKGPLANLFDFDAAGTRNNFNQMYAQPAYQQFQEELAPKITGQFRGGNLQNSSYLAGALGKAGTDVQRNLDAQLANMLYQGQQDAMSRRLNSINSLLNTQTFAYQKPQASASDQAFSSLLDVGGKALGDWASNRFKPGGAAPFGGG